MRHWDEEFSTAAMTKRNPFRNFMMIDDIIVDVNGLPENIKLQLLEMGIVELDIEDNENE